GGRHRSGDADELGGHASRPPVAETHPYPLGKDVRDRRAAGQPPDCGTPYAAHASDQLDADRQLQLVAPDPRSEGLALVAADHPGAVLSLRPHPAVPRRFGVLDSERLGVVQIDRVVDMPVLVDLIAAYDPAGGVDKGIDTGGHHFILAIVGW